jgi:hypothetical protein
VRWRQLDVESAERFESAGVHHACTSVEAVLFDNQDVAVVGAGNSAGQAGRWCRPADEQSGCGRGFDFEPVCRELQKHDRKNKRGG